MRNNDGMRPIRATRRGSWPGSGVVLALILAFPTACGGDGTRDAQGEEPATPVLPAAADLLSDSAAARSALERYWEHLSRGDFRKAAELYGGNWREVAEHWVEPQVGDTLSAEGFFTRTCGGMLVCDLRPGEVLEVELTDPTRLRLTVSLTAADGTPFLLGPCCGEEGEAQDRFPFTLRREGKRFLVEDLPIYVP
jgi:hypothetical protein